MTVLGEHTFHYGTLSPQTSGSDTMLSNVIRGASSQFTPQLAAKMNLLRGLDVPWYTAHSEGALGCYGPMNRPGNEGTLSNQVSVDQVLANSASFYDSTPLKRSMHIGNGGLSIGYADPSTRSGAQGMPTANNAARLFDEIFLPEFATPTDPAEPAPPARPHVVDRVLESYRRVHSGAHGPGARIGAADRRRLEEYMSRLSDVQARIQAIEEGGGMSRPLAACGAQTRPEDNSRRTAVYTDWQARPDLYGPQLYGVYNDVILTAFMCDSSRIATISTPDDFLGTMDSVGGFHEVAHTARDNAARERMLHEGSRGFFQMVYLDLIAKLDAVADADGNSMLDNSLVMWTQESGPETHHNDSQPVVLAGSAGGTLNTGFYCDYRDRSLRWDDQKQAEGRNPGLHYYGIFSTILDAFGVPRSEAPRGAGVPYAEEEAVPSWFGVPHPRHAQIYEFSTQSLPVIT